MCHTCNVWLDRPAVGLVLTVCFLALATLIYWFHGYAWASTLLSTSSLIWVSLEWHNIGLHWDPAILNWYGYYDAGWALSVNKLAAFRGHALPGKFIRLGTLRLFLRPYLGQNATRIFLRQVSHLKLEPSFLKWLLHTSIFPKLSMLKCEVSCLKTRRILSFFKVAIIIKKFAHVSSAPVCMLVSC